MVQIGAFEAKTHLPALLKRVEGGESVQITRRGVPVARLVPVDQADVSKNPREAMRLIREARKGLSLRGLKIKDLISEGRL